MHVDMTRSHARLVLLTALAANACADTDVPTSAPLPRLVLLADAAVPPTAATSLALAGDSVACIIESYEVRVLCGDRVWENVHALGKQGAGPGEFRTPTSLLGGAADQVGVYDAGLSRLTVFAVDGAPLYERSFPEAGSGLKLDGDEYIWYAWNGSESAGGPIVHRVPLPTGDGVRTALTALPPPPTAEPATVRAGATAFGDEWVFWTGAYQLVRYGPDGEQRGVLAAPDVAPELPSDLDAEMLIETIRAYFGRPPNERQLRGFRAKPKLPLNRDNPLRSDGRGRLWALTTRDHVRRSHFDVFERDGHVGTASVPDRVLGYDIRGDLLAALVLVPASEPGGMHGYRVRWYRIAAAD